MKIFAMHCVSTCFICVYFKFYPRFNKLSFFQMSMNVANFYICNILQMHNFGASAIIAGLAGEGEIMPGDNQIMSEHN